MRARHVAPYDGRSTLWMRFEPTVRVALVDWNQPRRDGLDAALERACDSAKEDDDWPFDVAAAFARALTEPGGPLDEGMAVSFAAYEVAGEQLRVVWAGDVRVVVESPGDPWQTLDHTIANLARQRGADIPRDDSVLQSALSRCLGHLPSDPPEAATLNTSPLMSIVIATQGHHRHRHSWRVPADAASEPIAAAGRGHLLRASCATVALER